MQWSYSYQSFPKANPYHLGTFNRIRMTFLEPKSTNFVVHSIILTLVRPSPPSVLSPFKPEDGLGLTCNSNPFWYLK